MTRQVWMKREPVSRCGRSIASSEIIGCPGVDTVMDEEVRALWVSMAQTWTQLAEGMERLQPRQGPGVRRGGLPQ